MSHRCLPLAALIGCLALVACGQSGGRGVTLHRTLGLGNRSGLDAQTLGKGCLDLAATAKRIAASPQGATLHSRDYDIGRTLPTRGGDFQIKFESVKDKASQQELARRSFAGQNAPVLKTSAKASEVMAATPAKELLDVAAQSDCRSITFASGDEFAITYGNSRFVSMTNTKTDEIREYGLQGESLVMTIFAPANLESCNGGRVSGNLERISTRLAWGKGHDTVKLVPAYAQRLGVDANPKAERFKVAIGDLPKKIDAIKCGQ